MNFTEKDGETLRSLYFEEVKTGPGHKGVRPPSERDAAMSRALTKFFAVHKEV